MKTRRALHIVDVVGSFMEGGELGVKGANHEFVESINELIDSDAYELIILIAEGHPYNHVSFKPWGKHGVLNTSGADFPSNLHWQKAGLILRKGTLRHVDSTSGFLSHPYRGCRISTGLDELLTAREICYNDIVGLEFSVCVADHAIDSAALQFNTRVLKKFTRSFDPTKDKETIRRLQKAGVKVVQ